MFDMVHRFSAVLLVSLLLYGPGCLLATRAASGAETADRAPHVALLLPLDSASFARHADAVRQGFLAAAKIQGKTALPIRVYSVDDDPPHVIAAYQRAVESGAQLVVGPLTRDGVSALAASGLVSVPTLALNAPELRAERPRRLYDIGLAVEPEARQVARLARDEGRRAALVIVDDAPLSRRMQQAFRAEFEANGGSLVAEVAYQGGAPDSLREWQEAAGADMVFLAVDAAKARMLRPYLAGTLALYATSQINAAPGDTLAAYDLNQVRFVDMPWFLEPDHPAVMIYPRPAPGLAIDLERLYALGIDAFRVGFWLMAPAPDPFIDGVTGRLHLGPGRQFVRELPEARFVDGKTAVVGEPPR
jgi:outer membrane PBP1 activator LpoA protein